MPNENTNATKSSQTMEVKHQAVIPQRHRELYCNKANNARRYSNDYIYGWPTKVDHSVFTKTQAEKDELKRQR